MHPKVDIVILNCNSGKSLKGTVLSLLRNTKYKNYHIIVVDNGSVDNSTAFLKDFKDILLIKNSENLGCPRGLNTALPYLEGKYAMFLNDDIVFKDPFWLSYLVSEIEKDDKIGAVGIKLYKYYKPDTAEYDSIYLSRFTAYAGGIKYNITQTHIVPYMGLGAIMVRSKIFQEIQFENRYFLYYDDLDFCLRLWFMGYKIKLVPQAWAYHKHQTAVKRNLTELKARYFAERNSLLTFLIFTNKYEMFNYLPLVMAFRILSITGELLKHEKLKAFSKVLAICSLPFHYGWIKNQKQKLKLLQKANITYTDISKKSLYDPAIGERKVFKVIKKIMKTLNVRYDVLTG